MTTSRTKPTLDSLPNEILKGVYESLDDFESVIQLACTSRALGAIYQENRWPILRANLSSHPAMRDGGFYNGFKLHKLLYPSKQISKEFVETILQLAEIVGNAAITSLEKDTPKLKETALRAFENHLRSAGAYADWVLVRPVAQDMLRREMRGLLYAVWYYHKKERSWEKKPSAFRSAELFLSVHPPGNGFPVLKTPEGTLFTPEMTTDSLATHLAASAYYTWRREGPSKVFEKARQEH